MSLREWKFVVLPSGSRPGRSIPGTIELIRDNWDDFHFGTTFHMHLVNEAAVVSEIGTVKIATFGMVAPERGTLYTEIPSSFRELDSEYFSLGQDSSFYEALVKAVKRDGARAILSRIKDLAVNPSRISEVVGLEVASASIFRQVSPTSARDEFHRLVAPKERDAPPEFALEYHYRGFDGRRQGTVTFEVDRRSPVPTNVHVLIGANGVGKTSALRDMRAHFASLSDAHPPDEPYLSMSDASRIAGVVTVSFSAFDVGLSGYHESTDGKTASQGVTISDIGLIDPERSNDLGRISFDEMLNSRFDLMLKLCLVDRKRAVRLTRTLSFLDSDLVLARLNLGKVDGLAKRINFERRSSGHKIVLLTLVSLVAMVSEKSLVLIDEPETHLHPALLASFTRALSHLLSDRNGIAIVATHSPVILQEVPQRCAWRIWSAGAETRIANVQTPTFGENVGVLTQSVFRVETEQAGYYRLLRMAALQHASYADAVESFGGELGLEARMTLSALMQDRSN